LCQFKAKKWDYAWAGLTACLARRPGFLWATLFRATAAGEMGRFGDAEKDFALALGQATDPLSRYVVLTNRGAFWIRQKRWEEGLADLREAIQLRSQGWQAYAHLARVYRGRGEWDEAVAALGQALERHPGDAELYHLRARTQLERRDWESARRDFEQAIAHEPAGSKSGRLAGAWVELGHLHHQDRDFAGALDACARALAVRPGYAPALRQRAQTLVKLGHYAEAGRALDECLLTRGAPMPEVYQFRGHIHARQHEYRRAVAAYTEALRLKQDAATLDQRGWAYLRLKSPRLALADFEAALKLDPGHVESLCSRGHARLSLGRVAEAVADAEETLRHGPTTERLLLNLACLYARASVEVDMGAARGRPVAGGDSASGYRERAVGLLREALARVPEGQRQNFWRQKVEAEPALASLRGSAGMLRLERSLPMKSQ
jgi:tetratricopeptide (TPR) repeat protein